MLRMEDHSGENSSNMMQQEDLFIDDLDGIFDDGPMSDELTLDTDEALVDFDDDDDNNDSNNNNKNASGQQVVDANDADLQPTPISSMMNGSSAVSSSGLNGMRGGSDAARSSTSTTKQGSSSSVGATTTGLPPLPQSSANLTTLQRSASEPVRGKAATKRTGKHIEGKGCPLPPPSWHSDAADRPHRQAMVIEIARLLQSRKRTVPSSDWLRQLPHKARKLEERLYRSASSLEAYLDKATLKTRLKKLAKVITRQFEEAKRQHSGGGGGGAFNRSRSSESSLSTTSSLASFASSAAASSLRDSFTSVNSFDSLRSLQESLARRSSLSSLPAASGSSPGGGGAYDRRSSGRFGLGSNNTALQALPEVPFSDSSSQGSAGPAGSAKPALPQQPQAPQGGAAPILPAPNTNNAGNLAEIERQRSVNAQLQQQIMENIRQQEELVRRMQGQQQQGGGNANGAPGSQQLPPTSNMAAGAGNFGSPNLSGGIGAAIPGNQPFQGMNALRGGSLGMTTTNLQMNPTLMAAMLSNRQFQQSGAPNSAAGSAMGGAQNVMLPNPLVASMNNRNMLQQAFAQAASSQGVTAGAQQQQQQQQQFLYLPGSPMMPDPSLLAAANAAAATGVLPGNSNYSPILPHNAPGASSSSMSGNCNSTTLQGALMPPPNVSSPRNSLQEAARVAKNGFVDDSEPLSPGSFNW